MVRVVLLVVLVILEGDDARLEGLECWSTKGGHSEAEEGNTQHTRAQRVWQISGERVTESVSVGRCGCSIGRCTA